MSLHAPLSTQSLQITNEHLALALDQAALGFWEVSLAEGNEMTCTDQCKRNFGRNPLLGFTYQEMLNAIVLQDQPAMQAAVYKAISQQAPYFAQYRVTHPDGSIRWIEAQGMVICDDGL